MRTQMNYNMTGSIRTSISACQIRSLAHVFPTLSRRESRFEINKEFYNLRSNDYLTTDLILAYPVNDCGNPK